MRSDGKHPDGKTQIPWDAGRYATWDVTVTDTLAPSNLALSAASFGAAAENAASKKVQKYAGLPFEYMFVPIALETLGPVNESRQTILLTTLNLALAP